MFHEPIVADPFRFVISKDNFVDKSLKSNCCMLLRWCNCFQLSERFHLLIVLRFHRILVMLRSYHRLRAIAVYVVQRGLLILLSDN